MSIELNTDQLYTAMDMEHWYHSSSTKQTYEISGAAGTGKTTLVLYLIDRLGLSLNEVLFVAYMGKAATQLARHGLPAKTIHSAIYNYETVPVRDENGHRVFLPDGRVKTKGEFILKDHLKKKYKLIVIDECGMVPVNIAKDILSYELPVIALGDLNQLPPVFGEAYFLQKPDSILRKIMRQSEGNPIIWLSQQILQGNYLKPGVYGKSAVIERNDLNDYLFKNTDIVITERNNIRNSVNRYYREQLYRFTNPLRPYVREKVICRKNNWDLSVGKGIYFTNGLTGTLTDINMASFNGKTIKVNFMPDFIDKTFNSVPVSYHHLFNLEDELSDSERAGERYLDKIEFAYAITCHSSQGSQYPNVVFLEDDRNVWSADMQKKIHYTAVTRAIDQVTYVLNH